MKQRYLLTILTLLFAADTIAQNQEKLNPFAKYGLNVEVGTITDGMYEESHDLENIVEIGSILFDVRNRKILGEVPPDTLPKIPAQITSLWLQVDPLASRYYHISPYAFCANNPIKYVDPTGMMITRYEDEEGNLLARTNDGSNAIVQVSAEQQHDFDVAVNMAEWEDLNSVEWNRAMVEELTGVKLTSMHEKVLGSTHSDGAKRALMQYWQSGSTADYARFTLAELGGQWTDPGLVAQGVLSGVMGYAMMGRQTVYRVFGGDARAQGFSWTTTNPTFVKDFRNLAGLPSGGASGTINTANFMIKGRVNINNIINSRSALPLDGNVGGLPELIIDPKNVRLIDFKVLKP